MNTKLEEITKKLYNEGVAKANAEAEQIINDAKKQAENIIINANKEAKALASKTEKDLAQLKEQVASEIQLASDQSLSLLKQKITEILSSSLSPEIKKTVDDVDFIKSIISDMVSKWDPTKDALDLNIILPEKNKSKLLEHFKGKASALLDKGVQLVFEDRMKSGFKIGPKDNSFVISFTESDFEEFFKSFLRPKTKEVLFKGE